MPAENRQEMLQRIPPMTELLQSEEVAGWLKAHPLALVTDCLRQAASRLRREVIEGSQDAEGSGSAREILTRAAGLLHVVTTPHLRGAINATGIILHTGLGRAVLPESVVDSIVPELKGYCTLAIDPATRRADRAR